MKKSLTSLLTVAACLMAFAATTNAVDLHTLTMHPDGTYGSFLFTDSNGIAGGPDWNQGAATVVYTSTSPTGDWEVFLYQLNSETRCQLTDYQSYYGQGSPRFRDDTTIWHSWTSGTAGESELSQLIIDGCSLLEDTLLTDLGSQQSGVFDLSENYICIYIQNDSWSPSSELYLAPIDDVNDRTRLTFEAGRDSGPDISPDETKIVYDHSDGLDIGSNIWVMDNDGQNKTQLTFDSASDDSLANWGPEWSPDMQQICFTRKENNQTDIWVMYADGTDLHNVTNTPDVDERVHAWLSDGTLLITTDSLTQQFNSGQLSFPSIAFDQCETDCVYQPIVLLCEDTINTLSIPVRVPEGVSICDMSTEGCITDSWLSYSFDHSSDSGFVHFALVDNAGAVLEPGEHTVAYIGFTKDDLVCGESGVVSWDTTLMGDNFRELATVNTAGQIRYPAFDATIDSSTITKLMAGDNNSDCAVNIADLTGMTAYMFGGGVVDNSDMIDVKGDCNQNISDLTYLVAYLFTSGPAPACPCSNPVPAPKLTAGADLFAEYANGSTILTLSSEVDLSGLEVHLRGNGAAEPVSLADANLELVHGHADGLLKLGLLDLQGVQMIEAGDRQIVEIPGEYEVVHALGSSLDHSPVGINLAASAAPVVPHSFALHQNYPNPFNPATTISFDSPEAADYTLTVYNTLGQVVKRFEGTAQAGENEVVWDASASSSGVYFYKLEVGNNTDTKKMMLLK